MLRSFLGCGIAVSLSLAMGCGGGGDTPGDPDGGLDARVTEDADVAIDAPSELDSSAPDVDASIVPDASAGSDGATAPDAAPTTDAASGCTSNADCGATAYCELPGMTCAGTGTCTTRPMICTRIYMPVCGCDDVTYSNACTAAAAGASVASEGECARTGCGDPPAGCCHEDRDCGSGTRCVRADCSVGRSGTCVDATLEDGRCWVDTDCSSGSCVGEQICACGLACLLPDAPGTCATRS